MSEKPKRFEKHDKYTLKIILEKTEHVDIGRLIANKKQLEEQLDQVLNVLKNVNQMLAEAKKLGLISKPLIPAIPKLKVRKIEEGKE